MIKKFYLQESLKVLKPKLVSDDNRVKSKYFSPFPLQGESLGNSSNFAKMNRCNRPVGCLNRT